MFHFKFHTHKAQYQQKIKSPLSLTLCPVRHQVHLAIRALPQLPDMLILLGYICCWQRGDGKSLHVLHGHRSAVARLGCGRAPSAAHPGRPRRRKRQARLDAVGQTAGRRGTLRADCTQTWLHLFVCAAIHTILVVRHKVAQPEALEEAFISRQRRLNAFSKCIGLPAFSIDHADQAFRYSLSLTALTGMELWGKSIGGGRGTDKWRVRTALRCVCTGEAADASEDVLRLLIYAVGLKYSWCKNWSTRQLCQKWFSRFPETLFKKKSKIKKKACAFCGLF